MGISAQAILDAIIQVMEGNLGDVRAPSGAFRFRALDGLSLQTQIATVREFDGHTFDVTFPSIEQHPSSSVGNFANMRQELIAVTIQIWTNTECTTDEAEWLEARAKVIDDTADARRALAYPDTLTLTLNGDATNIVDGLMMGPASSFPVWQPGNEDRENGILRSEIRGSLIITVDQPAP